MAAFDYIENALEYLVTLLRFLEYAMIGFVQPALHSLCDFPHDALVERAGLIIFFLHCCMN